MTSLPVVERRAGNGRCKSKTLVGIDVYYDIRRFSRPALVICVQPVQSFQGLILNGDRVGSLFSYPVNAQRAILIEGKKRCQSGLKVLPGCGKAISAA
jgi:hypothetical protein